MISWLFSAPLQKLQQNPKCTSQNQRWTIQPCNQLLRIQRVSLMRPITNRVLLLLLLLLLSLHPRVLLQGQAFSKTTAKCQALVHHYVPQLNLVKVTLPSKVNEQEKHRCHRPSAWLNEAESILKQAQFPSPWRIEEGGVHVTSWGVITDRGDNNTTAVKTGILINKYSRNQFDICPQRLLFQ